VHTCNRVRHGSGKQGKGSLSKKTERRMGKKGETPRGRNNKAATATGPGKMTMDYHWTEGVSLVTPASSPQLVKPTPPPQVSRSSHWQVVRPVSDETEVPHTKARTQWSEARLQRKHHRSDSEDSAEPLRMQRKCYRRCRSTGRG
jgi:hypothetical protein